MGDIAKKAEIKRPTAYIILDELMRKGFIDLLPKDNKTHYVVKSPEVLLKNLIEKEELTESFVPQLMAMFNDPKERPKITYYEGEDAVKNIYIDSIKENKEILALFGIKEMSDSVGKRFIENYVATRIKKNIKSKVIISLENIEENFLGKDKDELRDTKVVDIKKFPFKAEVMIYGNKVSIMSFNKSDSFGLIIQNDQFSETVRSIFNFMWENLS